MLSETIQQAVLAEIGRATLALKEHHQHLINQYKQQMAEYQTLQGETSQELELELLHHELAEKMATAQAKELDLEKRLAAEHAFVQQAERHEQLLRQELKDQSQNYEVRLQDALKAQHQAELEAVRANTRTEELTKQLAELKTKK